MASVGHVKVWQDSSRKTLLIDSRDPERRVHEWTIDDSKYPANVPGIVPRTLYVEGVRKSGAYSGDVRLLLKVQHRLPGETAQYDPKSGLETPAKTSRFKRYRTSYDHILLTIQGSPRAKQFVDGNSDGVWK